MTNSREQILSRLKARQPPGTELPTLDQNWIIYDDPLAQFQSVLQMVGGKSIVAGTAAEARASLPQELVQGKIYSRVPELVASTFDVDQVPDVHELDDVQLAVLPGDLFVAENAAIWMDDELMKHRVVLFIAQHVVIVVERKNLVHNLHQAYERLTWGRREFGVFVSGPSKTADIEQSLVIGAHGARSLTVVILDEAAGS